MIDLFDYSDFRLYLKDFYAEQKSLKSSFSYRYMSMKAEVSSSAFFKLVIEGKRNLTKTTVLKTAKMLKLSKEEVEYFENLVFFNQATSIEEKNHFFEKLIAAQKKNKVSFIQNNQLQYFSEWYHPVVRELVSSSQFNGDYSQLARWTKPSITERQAEASVKMMVDLGFLKHSGKGFEQVEPMLSTGPSFQNHQVVQYQIKTLELSIEAFDRAKASERMTATTTLAISEENLPEYYEVIREFRKNLQNLAAKDENWNRVYTLNTSFIPMSISIKG